MMRWPRIWRKPQKTADRYCKILLSINEATARGQA